MGGEEVRWGVFLETGGWLWRLQGLTVATPFSLSSPFPPSLFSLDKHFYNHSVNMNQIPKTIDWVLPQKQLITEGERQTPKYLQGKSSKIDVLVHMFFGGCWPACEHRTGHHSMSSSGQSSQTWRFSAFSLVLVLLCQEPPCPRGHCTPLLGTAAADSLEPGWCQSCPSEGGGGMGVGKPLFSFVFCFVMGVKAGKEVVWVPIFPHHF